MHRTVLALLALILAATIATTQFVSHTLSSEELKQALQLAKDVRSKRDQERTNPKYPVPDTESYGPRGENRWYDRIKFSDARYNAIGKLFIVPYQTKSLATVEITGQPDPATKWELAGNFQFGHCSAFYVAPTILATGAHCLRDNGVTAESKHVMLFRQQYDGSKPYSDDLASTFERVVVDWMYLAAYSQKEDAGWSHWSGFDYAFLRTNAPGHDDAVYTLVEPDAYLGTQLRVAGYPQEYAEYYEPVTTECTLLQGTSDAVKNDPGVALAMADEASAPEIINKQRLEKGKVPHNMDHIVGNQLFCLGTKGNMGGGGSGGPWFIHESELANDPKKAAKLREVVGILAWGFKRIGEVIGPPTSPTYSAMFKKTQAYAKVDVSAWFKEQTMFIYKVVKESKLGVSLVDAVKAGVKETKLAKIAAQLKKLFKLN